MSNPQAEMKQIELNYLCLNIDLTLAIPAVSPYIAAMRFTAIMALAGRHPG